MGKMKTFIPLNVSSKFAICGLPIRMDTYKNCSFGCKYCFANCHKIMEFDKHLQIADTRWLEKKLDKVFTKKSVKSDNFLEVLMAQDLTFHCGGMSDPFQPCEEKIGATKQSVDICNKYSRTILFSTKSDTVYGANIRPDLHSFQLSITGADKTLEPNVPDIDSRKRFFESLLKEGFKVGIRIQPFIPGVTTLDIVREFERERYISLWKDSNLCRKTGSIRKKLWTS
jgi:DNA repair photolyase